MAGEMRPRLLALAAVAALLACTSTSVRAASCSTVAGAQGVIGATPSQPALVSAVGQSVPADPANCVPAFCEAARDQSSDVQVAVGAGISEAYSKLADAGNDDGALALLSSACSISCGEVVVTAFAASQATSVSRLCDAGLPGNRSGVVGEIFQVNADGGGGGASSH